MLCVCARYSHHHDWQCVHQGGSLSTCHLPSLASSLVHATHHRARSESKYRVIIPLCVCYCCCVSHEARLVTWKPRLPTCDQLPCIALLSSLLAAHDHSHLRLCVNVLPLCAARCRNCVCSPLDCFASYTRTRTRLRCAAAMWCVCVYVFAGMCVRWFHCACVLVQPAS